MKTVLSLHRKWAHAVKTIRILQGLVSAPPLPPLGFEQVFGSGSDGETKVFWRRLECESVGRVKSVGVLCFFKVMRCLPGCRGVWVADDASYWGGLEGKFGQN